MGGGRGAGAGGKWRENLQSNLSLSETLTHPIPPPSTSSSFSDFLSILELGFDSKTIMVSSNMRLVISIARRYSTFGVSRSDLIQEGSLGLMRATEKYDPGKGFKFGTYASWWIQQAIFLAIAYQSRTVRLPVHIHNFLNKARKVKAAYVTENGREATTQELASLMGVTVERLEKVVRMTKTTVSLSAPKIKAGGGRNGDQQELSLVDTLSGEEHGQGGGYKETVEDIDRGFFRADLRKMMETLSGEERTVITLRYGVEDGKFRTIAEVAEGLGRKKAWVRSQETRALRKLRRPWYEGKLRDYIDAFEGMDEG